MNTRRRAGTFLILVACLVLLAAAALHFTGFPGLSSEISASNLNPGLQSLYRTVFMLVGWYGIVIPIIVLIAAFAAEKARKAILLFCGFALLVQAGIMFAFLGWFAGTYMTLASALLILAGGFLLAPAIREPAE